MLIIPLCIAFNPTMAIIIIFFSPAIQIEFLLFTMTLMFPLLILPGLFIYYWVVHWLRYASLPLLILFIARFSTNVLHGYYLREKPLSELLYRASHRAIVGCKWAYRGLRGTNFWDLIKFVKPGNANNQFRTCILTSAQFVDPSRKIDNPFEWDPKSAINQIAAVNNRMCKTERVPDPVAVKDFLNYVEPILEHIASLFCKGM